MPRSILVVDDEQDFLSVIGRILSAKGYEVETASSAARALARAGERFFNASILDISLPDGEGTELLSELLEMHPDMVAVMLTGHSSVQNAMQSLNRGAFAYLEKPLDPDHLLSVLRQGLDKQRLVLENRKLMQELENRNRVTGILLGVSQAVSKSLDQQEIIDSALSKVAECVQMDAGCVFLHEKDGLLLKGNCGFPKQLAVEMGRSDDGPVAEVLAEAKPLVINPNASRQKAAFLAGAGFLSAACVPLMVVGENIGVMVIASKTERRFTAMEVNLLTSIGKEIAIAVRNSQLYEEASSARALRDLDALRTEFLANVSHELRTPLAVIKGSANSLLQPDVDFDETAWREFLQSIDNDADRLSRLVDDLLMMSRLDCGAIEVRKTPCRLDALVESIGNRLFRLAYRHELKVEIPQGLPEVMADDGRIGEVLTNLVENAVRYSPEGTPITISASPDSGKKVIITVKDNGVGIPAELHEKVFDRFYQVNNNRHRNRNGTGLGLAICRGIVEAHGGRIWVESEEGRGASFSFAIPVS